MDTEDFEMVKRGFLLIDQNLAVITSLLREVLVELKSLNEWKPIREASKKM